MQSETMPSFFGFHFDRVPPDLRVHKVPDGAQVPHVYGWEHIVYLSIFLIISVATLVLIYYKVKKEKTVDIIVKALGGLLLCCLIANRISLIEYYGSPMALIPNTFCGTTSLVFALCAIFCKRGHLTFNFCVYAGFWGGVLGTFYPNFVSQDVSFLYAPTITGLLHHSVCIYLAVLMLMTGFFKPSIGKFYAYPLGFCLIMCYGVFLFDALDISESMYILAPIVKGTILTWYTVGPVLVLANLGLVVLYEKVIVPKLQKNKEPSAT